MDTLTRRSDDSSAKQILQWAPQGHRARGQPKNTCRETVGNRNVDNRLEVQLEEYGGSGTRQLAVEELSVACSLVTTRHKSRLRLSSACPCPATPRVNWPTTVSSTSTLVSDNCVLQTLKHSSSVGRAAALETGPLLLQDHKSGSEQSATQSQTMWAVIRPVQAVLLSSMRGRQQLSCPVQRLPSGPNARPQDNIHLT